MMHRSGQWRQAPRQRGKNDTVALREIAGVLGAIIQRDTIRGLSTIALEIAQREIERAIASQPDASGEVGK
jgi:hypothetical protein